MCWLYAYSEDSESMLADMPPNDSVSRELFQWALGAFATLMAGVATWLFKIKVDADAGIKSVDDKVNAQAVRLAVVESEKAAMSDDIAEIKSDVKKLLERFHR